MIFNPQCLFIILHIKCLKMGNLCLETFCPMEIFIAPVIYRTVFR